jgi:5-methylcytosine-specific restriction enzyme subunit McrC
MTHVTVSEYERLYRGKSDEQTGDRRGERRVLSEKHFQRLRSFDEKHADGAGDQIFEWRRNRMWPKNWVGVVQLGGLTVEILPKFHRRGIDTLQARRNLIYMLVTAGDVPARPRDVADLATGQTTLLDVFVDLFARRLREELHQGLHRSYERRAENSPKLKGKLDFSEHFKHNAARKDRFFVQYDDYVEDNQLNRIFKAACRRLRTVISRPSVDEVLKHCLLVLGDVEDTTIRPPDFDRVHFSRKNRRFKESFDFCRMLYLGLSPTGTFGQTRTYSLLFDMNSVYERFIADFMRSRVLRGDLRGRYRLHPQSKDLKRYLLWTGPSERSGPVRMRPDILLMGRENHQPVIIDTKWKLLEEGSTGSPKGISTGDLYQLYAYAKRFGARRSVLLYPLGGQDLRAESYHVPESRASADDDEKTVGVEFVDLSGDLARSSGARKRLAEDLQDVIRLKPSTESQPAH